MKKAGNSILRLLLIIAVIIAAYYLYLALTK